MGAWQPDEEPDEAMAGGPGWTEVEAQRHLPDDVDDLAELEPTEDERWAEVGAGLVSILDALGDVAARLDKLDQHLDGIAKRLSALEAAVEAEDDPPQVTVSVPAITREQAEEVAAVLAQAKQRQ